MHFFRIDPLPAVIAALIGSTIAAAPAEATLSVTPVIIDFQPGQPPRADIELYNPGAEQLYVVIEPGEIRAPGTKVEQRFQTPDPQQLGLLASPGRVILEPGQRKFVRVAMLQDAGDRDRVYRVTIKPVAGELNGPSSGLKLMVGYDALVIQRPKAPKALIAAVRSGNTLRLTNTGNTNAELFRGRQCDTQGKDCTDLPGERIYAGASVDVPLTRDTPVEYSVKVATSISIQHF